MQIIPKIPPRAIPGNIPWNALADAINRISTNHPAFSWNLSSTGALVLNIDVSQFSTASSGGGISESQARGLADEQIAAALQPGGAIAIAIAAAGGSQVHQFQLRKSGNLAQCYNGVPGSAAAYAGTVYVGDDPVNVPAVSETLPDGGYVEFWLSVSYSNGYNAAVVTTQPSGNNEWSIYLGKVSYDGTLYQPVIAFDHLEITGRWVD